MDIVRPPTRQDGVFNLLNRARRKLTSPVLQYIQNSPDGIDVMEEEWDNLLLLDACSYPYFKEVNTLPGRLESRISKGSTTPEFLSNNFQGEEHYDTIYISANAVVGSMVDELEFFKIIGLWENTYLKDGIGYLVHPETVVDKAKAVANNHPHKRLIIHFLQPHAPFVVKDGEILADAKYRYYDAMWRGDIEQEEIVSLYMENLKFVLGFVEDLIDTLEGRSVVSADHGELLGDEIPGIYKLLHFYWPIWQWSNYRFGHYRGIRVPELIRVPWLVARGGSKKEVIDGGEPADVQFELDDQQLHRHLKALGYR